MEAPVYTQSPTEQQEGWSPAPERGDAFSLAGLKHGDVLFRSPEAAFRGWADPADDLVECRDIDYVRAVSSLAENLKSRQRNTDVIFGAVPFSRRLPGRFFAPRQRRVPLSTQVEGRVAAQPGRECRRDALPDRQGYVKAVQSALEAIGHGEVDKVVLARALDILLDEPVSYPALLGRLLSGHRQGYTFAMPVPAESGGLEMLVGASPELLARRKGDRIMVNPLAGSAARQTDPVKDSAVSQVLAASEKDRHEHAIVVDDIRQRLAPLCRELKVPQAPSVIGTDTLWHLSTEITGVLADPATTALDVALALHPTPAICGQPAMAAGRCIDLLEPFERGFYAGLVGWQDVRGDGEWAIALRCAQIHDSRLRLYAGAGIVEGSDPEREYEETATKLGTLLRAVFGRRAAP